MKGIFLKVNYLFLVGISISVNSLFINLYTTRYLFSTNAYKLLLWNVAKKNPYSEKCTKTFIYTVIWCPQKFSEMWHSKILRNVAQKILLIVAQKILWNVVHKKILWNVAHKKIFWNVAHKNTLKCGTENTLKCTENFTLNSGAHKASWLESIETTGIYSPFVWQCTERKNVVILT